MPYSYIGDRSGREEGEEGAAEGPASTHKVSMEPDSLLHSAFALH